MFAAFRFPAISILLVFGLISMGSATTYAQAAQGGKLSALRILIVMGENVYYEKEIVEGFLDHLRKQLAERNIALKDFKPVVPDFSGSDYASPLSEGGNKIWTRTIGAIRSDYEPGSVDYFVTLGSFASMAIRDSGLVKALGAKGQIYLGVTSPQRAKLINQPDIAGVQYGTGGMDYGRKILELFPPNQKLVFIYQAEAGKGNIQDESIAEDFKALNIEYARRFPGARTPRFEIRPIDGLIDVDKLKVADRNDPENSEIYIGWYGLDNILAHSNAEKLRSSNLWIVPSSNSPQNLDQAGMIVTVDDRFVGLLGANIILKHLNNPQLDLGQEPIRRPRFKVFIKRDVLNAKGVKLLDAAFDRQEDVTYTYR